MRMIMKTLKTSTILIASNIIVVGLTACENKEAVEVEIDPIVAKDVVTENVVTDVLTINSSIKVTTLGIAEIPISLERMVPVSLSNVTNQDRAFSVFVSDNHLVFKKDNCSENDKAFYTTIQFYPTDESNIKKAGATLNNDDHVPVYYKDGPACMSIRALPTYSLRQIYIGQYEKDLGWQWQAKITGESLQNSSQK